MIAAALPRAEGATIVTLRGAKLDAEARTLDLTNLRLSFGQSLAVVIFLLGIAGTWFVTLWRVDDMSKRLDSLTTIVTTMRIDAAHRDGAPPQRGTP